MSYTKHSLPVQIRQLTKNVSRVARRCKMLCCVEGDRSDLLENSGSSLLGSGQRAAKNVFNARLAGSQEFPHGSRLLLAKITQLPLAVVYLWISNRISMTQKVENHRALVTERVIHHSPNVEQSVLSVFGEIELLDLCVEGLQTNVEDLRSDVLVPVDGLQNAGNMGFLDVDHPRCAANANSS